MPRIVWGAPGKRFYEAGIDRGVLYVGAQPGVPWNGLTAVNVNSTGGEAKAYYIDGVKYLNVPAAEEFEATINAYTYPDEFGACDGSTQVRPGLRVTQQRRKSFGFSYRTMIGNEMSPELGYKIHIVYNALAAPSGRNHTTLGESAEPGDFSWNITTRPPAISGYNRTSHVVIDSRDTNSVTLAAIEDILYGTSINTARLPDFDELVTIFDTLTTLEIVDNGDGTWTATGPESAIQMLDTDMFQITWPTAIFIDEDTYNISS
jgi:hypothetical protein